MTNTSTMRFRVYGIVQGVGFRPTVDRHARTAGIRGSVCNKGPYVEIFAQGEENDLVQFIHKIREGNRWIRVDDISIKETAVDSTETKFRYDFYSNSWY